LYIKAAAADAKPAAIALRTIGEASTALSFEVLNSPFLGLDEDRFEAVAVRELALFPR
jgi:hypothetical protein